MKKCEPRGLIQIGERNIYAGVSGKIAVFKLEFRSHMIYYIYILLLPLLLLIISS